MMNQLTHVHRFLDLMASSPSNFLVPTLDIDLVWHTHQLYGTEYLKHTKECVGRYVDQCVHIFVKSHSLTESSRAATTASKKALLPTRSTSLVAHGMYASLTRALAVPPLNAAHAEPLRPAVLLLRLPAPGQHHRPAYVPAHQARPPCLPAVRRRRREPAPAGTPARRRPGHARGHPCVRSRCGAGARAGEARVERGGAQESAGEGAEAQSARRGESGQSGKGGPGRRGGETKKGGTRAGVLGPRTAVIRPGWGMRWVGTLCLW